MLDNLIFLLAVANSFFRQTRGIKVATYFIDLLSLPFCTAHEDMSQGKVLRGPLNIIQRRRIAG